jgi:putative two-component system response regulator
VSRLRALLALVLLLAGAGSLRTQEQPTLRVHFIDVGQGDAVLIQSPTGQNVLYDAGENATRVRDYLSALGVTELGLVIASHNHADHIGGLPEVLRTFRPQFYMDNGIPATTQIYARVLEAVKEVASQLLEPTARRITLGDAALVVVPPPGVAAWDQNDNSVGIVIEYGTFRLSLGGDAEPRQWSWWLIHEPEPLQEVQIHKASHHGSINGDTADGLARLSPEAVVVSAGTGNSYGHILVVDDSFANRDLLRRRLEQEGYLVETAESGDGAFARLHGDYPDLVLLDVVMPGTSGLDVCARLKSEPATRLLPVVLMTTLDSPEVRLDGIGVGADDFLLKPVNLSELIARCRSLIRLKRHTDDLESAEALLFSLAAIVEARDAYTAGHCQRLSKYATAVGEALDLGSADLQTLARGGVLHDLGKIALPDAVLNKPGRLSAEEFALMQRHPVVGDELCSRLRSLRAIRPIVRHHHEMLDGTGYPDGLAGDDVPLLAQIMSIADAFDALTSDRPYRRAQPLAYAIAELRADAARGRRNADLVETFIASLKGGTLNDSSIPFEKAHV